jgi:hypothetical protein
MIAFFENETPAFNPGVPLLVPIQDNVEDYGLDNLVQVILMMGNGKILRLVTDKFSLHGQVKGCRVTVVFSETQRAELVAQPGFGQDPGAMMTGIAEDWFPLKA